jgi:hypothetical protein
MILKVERQLDNTLMPVISSPVQRHITKLILRIDVNLVSLEQQLNNVLVPVPSSPE